MRYNQEPDAPITIETQPPPSVLFPGPLLNSSTGYSPDASSFYTPAPNIFSGLDVRPRLSSRSVTLTHRITSLTTHPNPQISVVRNDAGSQCILFTHSGSSSTPSTGMAQAPRSAPLPNPAGYNTRTLYSGSTPVFPRDTVHSQRSPPFAAPPRRHPLTETPSPGIAFTSHPMRMETNQYGAKATNSIPPLQSLVTHGQLMHVNVSHGSTPVKPDITGTIDKGFFIADGEWTCYRRNYFSCICSYSLSPHIPGVTLQFTPNSSGPTYDVYEFAMNITAIVADSDSHSIELVQHTPKRDKGPITRPERVTMDPKPPLTSQHPLGGYYNDARNLTGGPSASVYGNYSSPQGGHPIEHTFERIQFKQATANNGKRRAAQQYYHLVIELWAHVSEAGRATPDEWMKVAHKKSAKMIVRGRSPGHYQSERRGSTSSGPSGGSGLGGFSSAQLPDYGSGPSMLNSGYGASAYNDPRSTHYGHTRHHDLPGEPTMSPDEVKAMHSTKEYPYYSAPVYESAESAPRVDMFSHRPGRDTIVTSAPSTMDLPTNRLKHEHEGTLPSLFYPGTGYYRGCHQFEGKSNPGGYYSTMLPQST